MPDKAQDDDRVMSLVELALAQPAGEREAYLRHACGSDDGLFSQTWDYVRWEERMQGFLLDPLYPSVANENPFEPGDLLDGRFRIVREVARGGMGIVYEAMDEKLERRIALKCAQTAFRHRLPPEVRNATAISHPNVCKTFEIHTASTPQGNIDFLTMEFLDGETLGERVARGPVPPAEARKLALQLCAGLAEAHRNGVIHGDLKSSNVILTAGADGEIRAVITDFGLAHRPDSAQRAFQSGQAGGTPDYMAPELWKGEKASVVSDIYALGIILYELLSGSRPNEAPVPGTVVNWEERLTRKPPAVHPKWDRSLARCLDPDPRRRFQSATEVAEALKPPSRRWLLAAAAAALLATGSGIVTYERATAPRESISVAMLPLEAGPDSAALASGVSRDAAAQLGRLRGGKRARLKFIPLADVARQQTGTAATARSRLGATHVVRGTLGREEGRVTVHVFLTDTRTLADTADREFQYAPGELRYAAQAVAGVVTSTLRLPPLPAAPMKPAAVQDYTAGLAYTRRNSTIDRALPLLERALEADPDSALTWAGFAEGQWFKYFVTQDRAWLVRSSESLRQAQNRGLDIAAVHRVAGLLMANAGSYEQAETEYLRAIELEPANGDAYRRIGQAYERGNQLDQALAAFKKAIELEPDDFKQYQALGTYYAHRADSSGAAHQFERCVQLAPDEPDAHYALGTAYVRLGRYVEAERELRTAIALGGTTQAQNNLAYALMYQARDREAIPLLVGALDRFPNQYLWWMNLGDAYRRTNLPTDSVRAYRRSLELAEKELERNPRDVEVRSRLAYLCARLGDSKRAESEIGQALRLLPKSSDIRGTAIWTYEAIGRREDSLDILRTSANEVLAEANRWPSLAGLQGDSRFQQLLAARQIK